MYLSNNRPGRPCDILYDFKRSDLDGRRRIAARNPNPVLVVWQLHECATSAPHDPRGTLPYAEFALEIAENLGDPDLLSWGHSELGNVHRLLTHAKAAETHLEKGIRWAVSPYQQADANRQRGVLPLTAHNDSRTALLYLDRAFEISRAATPRIYSDRGHPMVLQSKALAHLHHAALHDESHLEIAVPLLETVLETGCRRHARRARLAALNNLVAIPLTFDRPLEGRLVVRLQEAYGALRQKSSRLGARLRWVLLRAEIRESGYTEARRRRLLTVRGHLLEKAAYREAALLTLDVATHDVMAGSHRRAHQLLETGRPIFHQGGLAELSHTLLCSVLTAETLLSARTRALTHNFVRTAAAPAKAAP